MADYTDLPDTAVGVGGIPSGTTVTALRDNPIAIAERAVGAPKVLGANYDIIDRVVTSGSQANVDFTYTAADYDEIVFKISGVVCSMDGQTLWMRTSSDGGSSFDSGATAYEWVAETLNVTTSPSFSLTGDDADAQIVLATSVGSSGAEGVSGDVRLIGPSRTTYYKPIFADLFYRNTLGNTFKTACSGQRQSGSVVDAVRFLWSASNFENGGIITAYGVRNS